MKLLWNRLSCHLHCKYDFSLLIPSHWAFFTLYFCGVLMVAYESRQHGLSGSERVTGKFHSLWVTSQPAYRSPRSVWPYSFLFICLWLVQGSVTSASHLGMYEKCSSAGPHSSSLWLGGSSSHKFFSYFDSNGHFHCLLF